MIDIHVIINQIAVLFLIMAIGFIIGKLKILTPEGNKILSKVVLFVTLPCTILSSVLNNEMDISVGDTLFFLLLSFLAYLIAFAISIPVVRFTGGNKKIHGLLNYMAVFSNCAFMGFPVVMAVFGAETAFYIALFNIPFNLLTFSIGIFLISGKGSGFKPKQFLNTTLIVAILAIPVAVTGLKAPYVISETLRIAGSMTTPCAMILLGSTLAYVTLKDVFSEWRIFPVSALKLIIIPVITWFIFKQFVTNDLMLGILVVLSSMPTAAMSAMLAVEYKNKEHVASSGVFLSTLLCGVTVPLVIFLLL